MDRRSMLPALCLVALLGAFTGGGALAQKGERERERQPRMREALEHLQKAKESLRLATSDKGGHRVKALELVEKAIAEVEKGVKFDKKN